MIGEKKEGLFKYNDFELLYLAKENSEEAIEILLEKYKYLVFRFIKEFNIEQNLKEDYLQEGLLVINKAINIYRSDSNMTFTKFVEMLLYHRFVDMSRKNKIVEILPIEKLDYFISSKENKEYLQETNVTEYNGLSKFEYKIYQLKYEQNLSCKKICTLLNIEPKKVYSAIDRIKKKRKID